MKELADRVYNKLELHWRCKCDQRAINSGGSRVASLSLARHRQLAARTSAKSTLRRTHLPAKFEVLLPVCKDVAEWKITNVEVNNVM